MSETVLVLHSGGLDSTTCLLAALNEGHRVLSLGIDYGQRARAELQYAYQQCESRRVDRKVIKLEWARPKRLLPLNRSVEEIRRETSTGYLPGRNALFLALALAHAAGVEATRIVIGINCVDFSGYPDCKPQFLEAFAAMARSADPSSPIISAPLLHKSKPEIARMAFALGLRHGDTWSCYRPKGSTERPVPCGACDACRLHEYAWSQV
jgi:7-cyano-7-deazaguanine synthase